MTKGNKMNSERIQKIKNSIPKKFLKQIRPNQLRKISQQLLHLLKEAPNRLGMGFQIVLHLQKLLIYHSLFFLSLQPFLFSRRWPSVLPWKILMSLKRNIVHQKVEDPQTMHNYKLIQKILELS